MYSDDMRPRSFRYGITNSRSTDAVHFCQIANGDTIGVHLPRILDDVTCKFRRFSSLTTACSVASHHVSDVIGLSAFAKVMRVDALWIVARMQDVKHCLSMVMYFPTNNVGEMWTSIAFFAHYLTVPAAIQRSLPCPALIGIATILWRYIFPESFRNWNVSHSVPGARLGAESTSVAVALRQGVSDFTHVTQERHLAFFTTPFTVGRTKFSASILQSRGSNQKVLTAEVTCPVRVVGSHDNFPCVTRAELDYTTILRRHQLIVDKSEAYCVSA